MLLLYIQVQFDETEEDARDDSVVELTDPLQVICGDPRRSASCEHVILKVPSAAALMEFNRVSEFVHGAPKKFALKLLSIFFTDEELAESNCTYAPGRKLLDQQVLRGIQCMLNDKNNIITISKCSYDYTL